MTITEHVDKMRATHHGIKSGTYRDVVTRTGRKYVKVCLVLSNGQITICQFVDPATGDIYKPRSWKQRGRKIGNLNTIWGENNYGL